MRVRPLAVVLGWMLTVGLGGCAAQVSEPPPNTPNAPQAQNDWITGEMAQRRQQFAADLVEYSPLQRGTLTEGQTQDWDAVLEAGKCYSLIGVSEPSISDLDLFIVDADMNEVARDAATDNFPVLGLGNERICPQVTAPYYIRALAYSGAGSYGLQLFGTP